MQACQFGISAVHAKADQRADVAKDGLYNTPVFDLRQELVGKYQAHAELAGLGEQGDEPLRGQELKFSNVDVTAR
jgi:hypothetical protein